jgi:hypothetical protein
VSTLTHIGIKWVPPTLYKMGINYPIQKIYKYRTNTHGAPIAPPSGLLLVEDTPLVGVPPGPGGSRPIIIAPATTSRRIKVHHSIGTPTH